MTFGGPRDPAGRAAARAGRGAVRDRRHRRPGRPTRSGQRLGGARRAPAGARRAAAAPLEHRRAPDVAGEQRPDDRPRRTRDPAHRDAAVVAAPKTSASQPVGDGGQAERQRDQHAVDGEDAAPDPVGHDTLEPVRSTASTGRRRRRARRGPRPARTRARAPGRAARTRHPNMASAPPIAPNSRRSCGPARALPTNGPISAPTPRAAISSPSPISPASNLPSARIGRSTSTPPATPQPNFTASSARTRWSFRA